MKLPEALCILNVDVLIFTVTALEWLLITRHTLLDFADPWTITIDDFLNFSRWQFYAFTLACIAGTASGCLISLKLGRKQSMLLQSFATIVGLLTVSFTASPASYWVAVAIGGIANGAIYATLPTYVAEIATVRFRGAALASIHLSFAVSTAMKSLQNGSSVMTLGVLYAVLTALQVGSFWWFAPEAPGSSLARNRDEEAEASLRQLGGGDVELTAYKELRSLASVNPRNLRGGIICLTLLAVIVLGGSGYLSSYSVAFAEAFGDKRLADTYKVLTVLVSLTALLLVDTVGRKKLLLASMALLFLATFIMSLYATNNDAGSTIIDAADYLIVIGYNLGLGVLIWCLFGELLHTTNELERGLALCSYYILTFLFTEYALTWFNRNPTAVWILAVVNFAGMLLYCFIPETKGLNLYEIRRLLVK